MTNPIDTLLNGLDDPWGSAEDFAATEEEVRKGSFTKQFDIYSGEVEVISAQHIFDKKSPKDENFHNFNVIVANDIGETKTMFLSISFKKIKFGEKQSTYQAVQLRKLCIALGMPSYSLSGDGVELRNFLKKYLGQYDKDGFLPKWGGLKFYGSWKWPTGSLHMGSTSSGFEVLNADNQRAVFPKVVILDKIKNDFIECLNAPIVGATRDEVKAIVGQSGFKLGFSDLVKIVGIEGVNNTLLTNFDTSIKPSGVNDAHAQVKSSDDDVAF